MLPTSDISGGEPMTPYKRSGKLKDYNPAIDEPLAMVKLEFSSDASSRYVPIGMTMLKFACLLEALDWHLYATHEITLDDARKIIRWASQKMDQRFDIDYTPLPQ